jgi:hypothetical protein
MTSDCSITKAQLHSSACATSDCVTAVHVLLPAAAKSVRKAQRQAQLEGLLMEVIMHVNEKRAHIPPVVSSSPCSFPFAIEVKGGSRLSLGLDAMKRMLLQTSPPAVLS